MMPSAFLPHAAERHRPHRLSFCPDTGSPPGHTTSDVRPLVDTASTPSTTQTMYPGERFNSITHLAAWCWPPPAAPCSHPGRLARDVCRSSASASLRDDGGALRASTLYHSTRGVAKQVLVKFDHCAIYLSLPAPHTRFRSSRCAGRGAGRCSARCGAGGDRHRQRAVARPRQAAFGAALRGDGLAGRIAAVPLVPNLPAAAPPGWSPAASSTRWASSSTRTTCDGATRTECAPGRAGRHAVHYITVLYFVE